MIAQHNDATQTCQNIGADGASPDVMALPAAIQQAHGADVARLLTILDRQ
jgi:hypothetical protein